ncbi:MAG TPA: hypothetical protein VJN95_06285 [Gemmatimonadales bacterium]|nr:hypothetical protein [Gemmatimonadales bacterium]
MKTGLVEISALAASLALIVAVPVLAQDSPWDKYKPGSIAGIIASEDSGIREQFAADSGHHSIVSGDSRPTKATVIYTDSSRATPIETMRLLRTWVKSLGIRADAPDALQTEVLFREGGHSYWLPVQQQLIPALKREVKAGQQMTILVAWVGAEGKHTINWVFIVNEFSAE